MKKLIFITIFLLVECVLVSCEDDFYYNYRIKTKDGNVGILRTNFSSYSEGDTIFVKNCTKKGENVYLVDSSYRAIKAIILPKKY